MRGVIQSTMERSLSSLSMAARLARQTEQRDRPAVILPICQAERAAMGFRNLAAESEPNSRSVGFRRKKRHEKIRRVHDAWAFVFNKNFDGIARLAPADRDISMRLERGINCIVHQID